MVGLKIGEREVKLRIILRLPYVHYFAVTSIAKHPIAVEVRRNLMGVAISCQEKPRNRRGPNRGQH